MEQSGTRWFSQVLADTKKRGKKLKLIKKEELCKGRCDWRFSIQQHISNREKY
jgi:hypothetical protein